MKILLIRYHDRYNINSREIKNVVERMGIWPPLGLIYIATMLKRRGYAVEILDVLAQDLDSQQARKKILAARADLIGITATTPEIRGVLEAAHFAKEAKALVVVGGPHLGIFPEETISCPEIDFAIQGDGEIPLLRLVETLSSTQPNLSTVPGLVYKNDGQIYKNEIYVEIDLDSLPFPDWNLVNITRYSHADARSPLAIMTSGRGCSFSCGFCYRGIDGVSTRFRDPLAVVEEMEYLVKNWKICEIIFCNDTLTIKRPQIMAICEEILRRRLKVSWQGATRVDVVDRQMLKLMKRAGCKQLKFGVESGNSGILKLMQKEIAKEQTKKVFHWCREEKIRTGAYFIIGYVDENAQTIQETIAFAQELDPDFVMFYVGIPLPKTSFHELAVQRKKIDSNYWRDYVTGKRRDKMPYLVADMDKWICRAFRKFYARPLFLVKKLFNPDIWNSVVRNPFLLIGLFFPKNK